MRSASCGCGAVAASWGRPMRARSSGPRTLRSGSTSTTQRPTVGKLPGLENAHAGSRHASPPGSATRWARQRGHASRSRMLSTDASIAAPLHPTADPTGLTISTSSRGQRP